MWSIRNTFAILGLCLVLPRNAAAAGSISLLEANAALPDCARTCLLTAIAKSPCELINVDCICKNQVLNDVATACVKSTCTVKESLTTKNTTSYLCGVPIRETDSALIPLYSVFIALAIVAVSLRLLARVLTQAYFWWDDLCNLFAFFGATGFTGLVIKSIQLGQGKDVWNVPFDNVTKVVQSFFTLMLIYTVARFFMRASIILFYLRVFPPRPDNKLGRILQFTLVFNFIYNISFFFAVLFQCQPIPTFWLQWEGHTAGHCGNAHTLIWVAAGTGIAFDVWLLALPLVQLLKLNMHWKKKVMGSMMLLVGAVVLIISLIRLKTINQLTRATNPTRDIVQIGLWSGIELDVGVICPCLPSFRLLLRRLMPRMMGTTGRYEMNGGSYANNNNNNNTRQVGIASALRSGIDRKGLGGGRGLESSGSSTTCGGEGGLDEGKIYVENTVVVTSMMKSLEAGGYEKGAADARSCGSAVALVEDRDEERGRGRSRRGR